MRPRRMERPLERSAWSDALSREDVEILAIDARAQTQLEFAMQSFNEVALERDRWREKAQIFARAIGAARLALLQGSPREAEVCLGRAVDEATEALGKS